MGRGSKEGGGGGGGGVREDNVSSGTIGRRVVLVDGSRGILPPDNARPPARQRLLS